MRFRNQFILLIAFAAATLPARAAEFRSFVGVDVVAMETTLDYSNGSETYEYTGLRLRYGIESDEGGSAGLELIFEMDDEITDPFDQRFELVTGPAIGAYFTVGKPVYLRLGISATDTEYTHVASGTSDDDIVSAVDIGLGFNFSPNRDITIYGEIMRRESSDVDFGTFFFGDIDHESDMVSFGLNYMLE